MTDAVRPLFASSTPPRPRAAFGDGARATAAAESRGGFTLIELLAVFVIIALITAVAVPVVMQALSKARNAAIKAEIDMLHMAIMNYKNEYGSFPPCTPGVATPSLPVKHLTRIFPRVNNALQQLVVASKGTDGAGNVDPTCRNNFDLSPSTALVFWLEGYTSNPSSPLVPASARSSLFGFEEGRKLSVGGKFTGLYHPAGKPGSPYVYIDSPQYFAARTTTSYVLLNPFVQIEFTEDANGNGVLDSGEDADGDGVLDVNLFNQDTFQILCAGRDGEFGTDDDLSNFWPGTRREYLDSL